MHGIQAVRFGKPDVLEYNELPDPVPESGQVLIEVRGASVNFADIKARSGAYHLGKKPPYIPGLDVAGVVLEVGSDVTEIKQGDHVIAFPASGSYAEKTVANQELTFVIPKTLDFINASAAALVAGTATHMLKHVACIEKQESLLVHAAAGGIGTTALQIAKAFGVSTIIASIGSAWKEDHVRKMGASGVVDYSSKTYGEDIKALTDGRGVAVILNPIGGVTIEQDLQCLAPFGRLVVFGDMAGESARIPADGLYTTNRSILGCSFGHYRRFQPESVRQSMNIAIELLVNKHVEIFIHECLHLREASKAHDLLEKKQSLGKVVLVPETFYGKNAL